MQTKRVLATIALLALPANLYAQNDRQSHFGVVVSFSPESKVRDEAKIVFDAERVDIKSQDFEIGFIVRGRELGGDWGVSHIQKTYKEGSVIDNTFTCDSCGGTLGRLDIMRDVRLRGLVVHKFAPFVTIKQRAQIGITFGGGVTWPDGTAERHEFDQRFVPPNQSITTETVSEVDAKELFLQGNSPVPVFKVELAAAVILAPGLKARFGGGISFTNYPAFSVSGVYLIGSKR